MLPTETFEVMGKPRYKEDAIFKTCELLNYEDTYCITNSFLKSVIKVGRIRLSFKLHLL